MRDSGTVRKSTQTYSLGCDSDSTLDSAIEHASRNHVDKIRTSMLLLNLHRIVHAGATAAGACAFCQAGTYSTGSGNELIYVCRDLILFQYT